MVKEVSHSSPYLTRTTTDVPDHLVGFTLPCTTNATLSLTFAGTAFNIQPSDLTFLPVTDDLMGDCVSGISSGTIGGVNEWLVGAVFLKS